MSYSFNAEDAKKLTEQAAAIDGPYGRAETEKCLDEIKNAALKGEFSCFITPVSKYREIVVKRLRVLGFKVTDHHDYRDGHLISASWK